MLKDISLFKRIVSGLSAVVMMTSSALSYLPMTVRAEESNSAAYSETASDETVFEDSSSEVAADGDISSYDDTEENSADGTETAEGEPRAFEFEGEDISVTAEMSGNTVFTDGSEELSASDVVLNARESEGAGFGFETEDNERVKYFDVGFETEEGTPVSADGITAQIELSVTAENGETVSDIEVYALDGENGEPVQLSITDDTVDGDTETVTVEDYKLGSYAVKYTVDFHYDELEYNIYGGGSVLLSEVFEAFGIEEDVSGSTVEFTDSDLLRIEMIPDSSDVSRAADWRLVSLKPFNTSEVLTVRLANGRLIELGVTDDATSNREISVLDLKITEGAEKANLFMKAAETYYDEATNSYILPANFKYTLPTNPRTEWNVSGYEKATHNSETNTYTIKAADIPDLEAWVWTPDSSDEDHRIVYSLHLVTAGYNVINPGELEIRLPKSILNGADNLELSIVTKEEYAERQRTAKDSKNIRFVYEFDGNDIVFTNVKEIPSGFDGAIYIAYHTAKKTYEYQDMSVSDDVQATASIYDLYDPTTHLQTKYLYDKDGNRGSSDTSTGHRVYHVYDADGNDKGTTISPATDKPSNAAPVYIDTEVEIRNLTKTLTQSGVYQEWNTSWGAEPAGDYLNDGGYVYFVWEIKSEIYTQQDNPTKITQKYDFTLEKDDIKTTVKVFSEPGANDPDNGSKIVNAENIMYKMAGEGWKSWEGSNEATRTIKELTEKNGTIRRDYVLTRIPRSQLKTTTDDASGKSVGTAFQIENEATTKVHPLDGVDADTSRTATEKFTYAPPVYVPPVAQFDMTKVGVYTPSENTVYNEKQISSFNLESLKNEETQADITGLRYHVNVNAEGLAHTIEKDNYSGKEEDALNHKYQQQNVDYKLTDNRLELINLETGTKESLGPEDYEMTAVDVNAEIKAGEYKENLAAFVSRDIDASQDSADANVFLRVYENGGSTPVDVAEFNQKTKSWTVLNSDYVGKVSSSFRGFTRFNFLKSGITGYELYSSNPYYGTYYKAYPTVTLKSTEHVRTLAADTDEVQLNNYADLNVHGTDFEGKEVNYNVERMGKTYSAEAKRYSYLTKQFISTDYNDIMNGEYLANWEIEFYEIMQIDVNDFQPVVQGGGTFYDLLPIMSTARLDEIEVYPMYEGKTDYEKTPLHEGGDYTIDYTYKTDKSGFKRVLLKVDISEPAVKYKLKIRTIHTHADIIDYGRNIRNSVCYKTGNPDLGEGKILDGSLDGGGTIVDGSVFINMGDEIGDTDKKKFKFSQATHYIPALISTVSEIQKTVSSETSPTASLSAIVTPNEEYEYHYRNMNTGSTYSTNLVIMDSIENYRTDENGKTWNGSQAFSKMRDWYGTPLHFNLQLLDRKGIDYKIYVTDQEVNLGKYNTDTTTPYNTADPTKNDPDREVEGNDYKFIAHQSEYKGEGDSRKLTSTFVNDVLTNDDGWVEIIQHSDYENNSYTFTRASDGSAYDFSKVKSFMIDFGDNVFQPNESVLFGLTMRAPSAVGNKADPNDSDKELKTFNNIYRYHDTSEDKDFKEGSSVDRSFTHQDKTDVIYRVAGDIRLRKVDASDNTKVVHNAVFVLEGTSAYGTSVKKEMSTDANGNIVFKGIEQGTYILRETDATANYQLTEPRTVTVDANGIAEISGADDIYAFDITIEKKLNGSKDAAPQSGAIYFLTRTDGTEPIDPGAGFFTTLTDASGISEGSALAVKTNSAGVARFTNVPAGNYILTRYDTATDQIVSSELYNIKAVKDATGKVTNVVVNKGTDQGSYPYYEEDEATNVGAKILLVRKEYGIEDEPRYHADVHFVKVLKDPATGNTEVLPGAEFTLTTVGNGSGDHADVNQYYEKVEMTATSTDTGVTFENIAIGKYVLYESKTPAGAVPEDKVYYVWVQGDKNTTPYVTIYTGKNYSDPTDRDSTTDIKLDPVTHEINIENTKTSETTLHKRDDVNLTEMLAGAQFELYPYGTTEDGNTVTEYTVEKSKLENEYQKEHYTLAFDPDKDAYKAGDVVTISYTRESEEYPELANVRRVVSPVYEDGLSSDVWRNTSELTLSSGVSHVETGTKVQLRTSDTEGLVKLYELQPGIAYRLCEIKAPKNHAAVDPSDPPEWDVRVTSTGEVKVFKDNTELTQKVGSEYVLTNRRTYEGKFTVVKNWIGGSPLDGDNPTTFPVIAMSTQEKETEVKVATLNKTLFKNKFPSAATTFTRLDIATNPGDQVYGTAEDAWDAIAAKEVLTGYKKVYDENNEFLYATDANGVKVFERVDANALTTPTDGWYKTGDTYKTPDGGTATIDYPSEEGVAYMAYINNHSYFWSDAKKIHLWKYCNGIIDNNWGFIDNAFNGYNSITGVVDFSYFCGDRVEQMLGMFRNSGVASDPFTLIMKDCYTPNINKTNAMFENANIKTIDISSLSTENVVSVNNMFYGCSKLEELTVGENFKLNSINPKAQGEFPRFNSLINLKEFNGSQYIECRSATSMADFFADIGKNVPNNDLELDLSGLICGNATTFVGMFQSCGAKVIDISRLETPEWGTGLNCSKMFYNCTKLETIYANPYEWPHYESADNWQMFDNCNSLTLRVNYNFSKGKNSYCCAVVDGSNDKGLTNPKGGTDNAYHVSDGKYQGYFTDWSQSPNYAYVYNKYRETHPDLPPLATTGGADADPLSKVNSITRIDPPSAQTHAMLMDDGDDGFTPPEVFYKTAATEVKNEELAQMLSDLGLTQEPGAHYVKETVTVDSVTVATLLAKWVVNSDNQWECTMLVYDPDAKCYVWEDKKISYTSGSETKYYICDHESATRLEVPENTGTAEITNKKENVEEPEYGTLAISKQIYLNDSVVPANMRGSDQFTFTVTLTPTASETVPNRARYGGIEFIKSGNSLVGTVKISKTVQNENTEGTDYGVLLTKIPVDWTYSITEDSTGELVTGRAFTADYTDSGAITDDDTVVTGDSAASGTIVKDGADAENKPVYNNRVTWKNDLKRADLVLMKKLTRQEDNGSGLTGKELTDTDKNTGYQFSVSLTGLLPSTDYSYTTALAGAQSFTSDADGSAVVTVVLKDGEQAEFSDLPIGTVYSFEETVPDEANVTYETTWNKYEGAYSEGTAPSSAQQSYMSDRLDENEWVRFDNNKITKKTVDVNVEKFWFADWAGQSDAENSAETAVVTLQRNDGMYTVTPDDSTRTLDSSNGWKNTFADLPVTVDGREVSYTIGELTVGGYKPGIVSSTVGDLVYGPVNTLVDTSGSTLAYFAYKTGYTFKIGEETYPNKAVEVCKYNDTVYIYYEGKLYTVDDSSGEKIATLYSDTAYEHKEGTQHRFMKNLKPDVAGDLPVVYGTYVYADPAVYYEEDAKTNPHPLRQVIVDENDITKIHYILHTDGIYYSAVAIPGENGVYRIDKPVFKWNTSDDVISDPEGNLNYTVTNVKIKTYSVSITKNVAGNFGNKAKMFEFDVIAGSLNGEYLVDRTYNGVTTHETIIFTSGVGSIEIGHGQTVKINNLPDGTNVTVREREYKNYSVTSEDDQSKTGKSDKGGEITVTLSSDRAVTFTNTLIGTVPTGLTLPQLTLIITAAFVIGSLAVIWYRRRREQETADEEKA